MATRSSIGVFTKDNKIKAIYCHWDGYPEGVGSVLVENYNTEEKIEKLLELGDISSIGETPEKCCAYHRDRGEELRPARIFENKIDMLKYFDDCWCEYSYLFKDGNWYVYDLIEIFKSLYEDKNNLLTNYLQQEHD